ncbi:MAG: LysR family transcriptional regulator [Leptolyngbya sp. SIO1E4]|nr:LysR family transcriptional regulator [Leptolyngbya sp. SIO1E4]
MDIYSLRYFVAVAEDLNFGRAAARLHITQPALSRHIHRLEETLNVQLLHRTKRTVELTEAGAALLVEARKILEQVESAIRVVQQIAQGERGSLRIAFTPSSMHTVLPEILKHFCDRYPNVKLAMSELCTRDQVKALQAETIDVGLLHPPISDPFLKLHPLPGERLVVALPHTHVLAPQPEVPLKSLSNEPFILHPRQEGPTLYDKILSLCRDAGFEPHIIHGDVKHQARVGLVAAGMGITFVPESLQHASLTGVSYCRLRDESPELQLAVAWRQTQESPVLQQFLQVVEETTGGNPLSTTRERNQNPTADEELTA